MGRNSFGTPNASRNARTSRASADASARSSSPVELFSCLAEAQVLIEDWRQDPNHRRPHSALGMMTPAAFAVG